MARHFRGADGLWAGDAGLDLAAPARNPARAGAQGVLDPRGARCLPPNRDQPADAGYALAAGGIQGTLFAFVFSAQQVFTGIYKLGHYFPLVFAGIAFGVAVAGFLNARLVGRLGMRVISHSALVGFIAVAATLFAAAQANAVPLPLFMALSALMMFAFGLMIANFTALAMEPQGDIAGTASSLYGSITTLLGIGIGTTIGQAYDGTLMPFATGFLACTLATLAVVAITEKGQLFKPHHQGM